MATKGPKRRTDATKEDGYEGCGGTFILGRRSLGERTVHACIEAKIAKGEVVHVDASLIRADVSWDSLAVRHVEAVRSVNEDAEAALKRSRKTGKFKKVCVTDPDASMATNGRNRRLEPAKKQHAVVDDLRGAARSCARPGG